MERVNVDEAVRLYIAHAVEKVGSLDRLAEALEPELGERYSRENVGKWARGDGMPPGRVLVAVRRVTKLSFDEVVDSAPPEATLLQRIERLEGRLRAWEIEWAARSGQVSDAAEPINVRQWVARVEELEGQVRALREQEA